MGLVTDMKKVTTLCCSITSVTTTLDRQRDRETERQRDRDTHRHTERDIHVVVLLL